MTWKSITPDEVKLINQYELWRKTAMEAVKFYAHPDFYTAQYKDYIPSEADLSKSALFERIRSGRDPLPEPPPIGLACPWYSIVEDPQDHWSKEDSFGMRAYVEYPKGLQDMAKSYDLWENDCKIIQYFSNDYEVVKKLDKYLYVVRDWAKRTSYRFFIWKDPEEKYFPPGTNPTKFQPWSLVHIINVDFKLEWLTKYGVKKDDL